MRTSKQWYRYSFWNAVKRMQVVLVTAAFKSSQVKFIDNFAAKVAG